MQAHYLKISLLLYLLVTSPAMGVSFEDKVRQADSLFAAGNEVEAARIYQTTIADGHTPTDPMLLKLASAYERQNDVPHLLYYLQVYFDRHPDDAVLRKMNEIARANNLNGYETDDLNYFYLFYRKYGTYLLLFLLLPGGYVFSIMMLKIVRKQPVDRRQKWVVLFYLILLLLFVNLPEGVQSGITSRDRVLLRSDPSAAAPVIEVIGRGHKVNILGSKDIYLRVLWRNELYYIRQDNVWVI
ncbi:MAG: hypothetical protein JWP57_1202 [Spirosoma sp.]|nr:hypothetical protein [Spirosoma sp.]